jgi:hypothetical protein
MKILLFLFPIQYKLKGGLKIGPDRDEKKIFHYEKLDALMKENDEILAIVVASLRTAKKIKYNLQYCIAKSANKNLKIETIPYPKSQIQNR